MKVVYGMPAAASAPNVQFGITKGFFRDEGIDLAVKPLYGGPALAKALNSGEISFGHLGTPPALIAHNDRAQFRIVGGGIKQKAHLYLGLRAGMEDVRLLRGGKLGLLSLGSCDEWIGRRMLETLGVGSDGAVQMVAIGDDYDELPRLFAERRIDAALAIEPSMSAAEHQGVMKIRAAAYEPPYLPVFQWTVLAASDELIHNDASLLKALLRAYVRSSHELRRDIAGYITFVADTFTIPPTVAKRSVLRELAHYELDAHIDMQGMQKAVELLASMKAIEPSASARHIVNLAYLPG